MKDEGDCTFSGDNVNWGPTTRDASGGRLRFDDSQNGYNSLNNLAAYDALDHFLCAPKPLPVIVGVRGISDPTNFPGHFVLVTGREVRPGSSPTDPPPDRYRYLIADPARLGTTLIHSRYPSSALF